MTDSQQLLAEYAQGGSEPAFRKLVARYLDLVYSAAVRLMDGDRHLAEDVAQIVFADLARRAPTLSRKVMLGGWLHRHTCYIAASLRRRERRRQARERQAAEMNAQHDLSDANLAQLAPLLDEAINRLGAEDRAAILLRFFEQRDFRSIGRALGSTEDAAQKRVSRALDKLHSMLKRRGVALSVAALGTALAGEAVSAAPAGLAASISVTALGGAAGAGTTFTLMKIMTMAKVKAGLLSAVVVAGLAASLIVVQQSRANLRQQSESWRQRSNQIAQLTVDYERLTNLLALAHGRKSNAQLEDLTRLRGEAASLRARTGNLAVLRAENQKLRREAEPPPETPLQIKEDAIAKVDFVKYWLLSMKIYASEHNGLFPTNQDQAVAIFHHDDPGRTNVSPDEFELVYTGPDTLKHPNDVIMFRQKKPRLNTDGRWTKIYGMVAGGVFQVGIPQRWTTPDGKVVNYDSFKEFERDHIVAPPSQ